HVPVLRRQRGARLRLLAADVAAGRLLGAVPAAPGPGARARLRLAVAGRPAAAGAVAPGAVALVAARAEARHPRGAVPGAGVAARDLRALCDPEPGLFRRCRVHPGPRAGARAVRGLLR